MEVKCETCVWWDNRAADGGRLDDRGICRRVTPTPKGHVIMNNRAWCLNWTSESGYVLGLDAKPKRMFVPQGDGCGEEFGGFDADGTADGIGEME